MYKKFSTAFKGSLFLIAILFGSNAMAETIRQQNINIVAQFAEEVFVKKDFSKLDQYMKEDYIQHNPLVGQGRDGFHDFFKAWFKSAPDFKYTLNKIIADDSYVWVYGNYAGTQKAEWLGIPANDANYNFAAVDIFRIEDGRLAEHWDVLDVYTLFKQLGTIQ